jgi:hypothetical protein
LGIPGSQIETEHVFNLVGMLMLWNIIGYRSMI